MCAVVTYSTTSRWQSFNTSELFGGTYLSTYYTFVHNIIKSHDTIDSDNYPIYLRCL